MALPTATAARLRQAGLSTARLASLGTTYDALDPLRQSTLRRIVASRPDETLRRVYGDDTVDPAVDVAGSVAAAHDTDTERETFVPGRLSSSAVTALLDAIHDTDPERETFVPARLSAPTLASAFAPLTGGSIVLPSTEDGGPDQTDSTHRLNLQSWQTNGQHFYGELLRLDGMGPITKNAIAMRLPRPALPANSSITGQTAGDLLIVGPSNIGFETDAAGWTAFGTGTAVARDLTTGQFVASGSGAGKITFGSGVAAGGAGIRTTLTGLIVGNLYVVRAWVGALTNGPQLTLTTDGTAAPTALTNVAGVQPVTPVSSAPADGLLHQLILVFRATATSHVLTLANAATTTGASAWVDQVYVTPPLTDPPRTVGWIVTHYEAQSGASVHGHLSFEVPDANDNLQTRFEIPFIDANNKIGVDKANIKTNAADFTVRCVGTDHLGASQQQVLRIGGFGGAVRAIEFSSDQETGDPAKRRWLMQTNGTTEGGSNTGSDFAVQPCSDAGTPTNMPLVIKRSNGQVYFGGTSIVPAQTDGAAEGVQINRNHAGVALTINSNLTGGTGVTGYALQALDATSRAVSTTIASDTTARFVAFADGKHEWGPGASTARDTNLYRKAADVLATDDDMEVVTVGKGILLHSPDGARWRITVSNAGALTAVSAP